jgi:hypothetical protein
MMYKAYIYTVILCITVCGHKRLHAEETHTQCHRDIIINLIYHINVSHIIHFSLTINGFNGSNGFLGLMHFMAITAVKWHDCMTINAQ